MAKLPLGQTVAISKENADYIVTEYGIADIKGKSLRERGEAIIGIAHPEFRDELKLAMRREQSF